jgi:hypothetical protein
VTVFATEGLLDILVEFAADRDPQGATVSIAATPAGDLSGADARLADLDPEMPVLTHFYLPGASSSVNSVFGVDLGTPSGGAQARFVSHPTGPLGVTKRDDLASVVLVAVAPWERETIAAFDRRGTRLELAVLAAEPPAETLE